MQVHYSIARCGVYQLHVALRQDGTELPGEAAIKLGPAATAAAPIAALRAILAHKGPEL